MKNHLASYCFMVSISCALAVQADSTKFSIAQIPDTQSYFFHPGWADPGQIIDMYQWVINDQKNNAYKYIFHVGDIIEEGGVFPAGNAETQWEWQKATQVFNTIAGNMRQAGAIIPYGFSLGNHDPLNFSHPSITNPQFGNGDFLPNTTMEASNFLKTQYEDNPNNAHNYISIPETYPHYTPSSFQDPDYFISYRSFQINGVNFIAVNAPYFLKEQAYQGFVALGNFISSHQNDSLVILNSHSCDQALTMARGHRNVFMVLCGHDPSAVYNTGIMDHIGVIKIDVDPNPPPISLPIYRYRFDFQAIYTGIPPSDSNYLPQHPVVRTYDFVLNKDNGTLSWQANDIQPWGNTPKTFTTDYLNNPNVKFAYDKNFMANGAKIWAPNVVFDSSKYTLKASNPASNVESINYKQYLGQSSKCPIPIRNDKLSNCNKKIGSEVSLCWDNQPGTNPSSYIVESNNNDNMLPITITDKSYEIEGQDNSSQNSYSIYAVCDDGTRSAELKIIVPSAKK